MTKVKWTMSIVLQNLLRRFVRTGGIISAASNYVPFLQNIFDDKTDAKFVVKEIEKSLRRHNLRHASKDTQPLRCLIRFQVIVLTLNASSFKAVFVNYTVYK